MDKNKFPDFIIAGAAKSGTTALHYMLDQHPDIFMSGIKETNYFVYAYERARKWRDHSGSAPLEALGEHDITDTHEKYRALFKQAKTGQLLGESSPLYLLSAAVPKRMSEHNPALKVVLILRNPAEVAYANFVHQVRDRTESLALEEIDRIFDASHYKKANLHPFSHHLALPEYSTQLPKYIEFFSPDNLHIIIYEEFIKDKKLALSRLFDFLKLAECDDINVDKKVNISAMPRNKAIQDAIRGNAWWKSVLNLMVPKKPRRRVRAFLEAMNSGGKPAMSEAVRSKLDQRYSKDVNYVESFLGRSITVWRKS